MRTMYDSVTAADIPSKALMVMGYGNGEFEWSKADWARFPKDQHVHVDVTGRNPDLCGVLDFEHGDVQSSATLRSWVEVRHNLVGPHSATVYCNKSSLATVQAALHGLEWHWFAADPTGEPHELTLNGKKAIAVQYAWPKQTGGHYDLSAVYDDAWHPKR